MTLYDELSASARDLVVRTDEFRAAANSFPARLRAALGARLAVREDMLQLQQAGSGPAWQWSSFEAFDAGDQDPEGYFTFAVSIRFGGIGDFIVIAPSFKFRPISGGFEVFMPDRQRAIGTPLGTLPYEIHDDVGWQPLVDECFNFCRRALEFDPFEEVNPPPSIGFDTSPPHP